jgi:hypothetical protein
MELISGDNELSQKIKARIEDLKTQIIQIQALYEQLHTKDEQVAEASFARAPEAKVAEAAFARAPEAKVAEASFAKAPEAYIYYPSTGAYIRIS